MHFSSPRYVRPDSKVESGAVTRISLVHSRQFAGAPFLPGTFALCSLSVGGGMPVSRAEAEEASRRRCRISVLVPRHSPSPLIFARGSRCVGSAEAEADRTQSEPFHVPGRWSLCLRGALSGGISPSIHRALAAFARSDGCYSPAGEMMSQLTPWT